MNSVEGNVLIIKKADNSFEEFYNRRMADYGIDVLDIRELRGYREVNSFLQKQLLIGLQFAHIRKWKSELKKYKTIILFGSPSLIPWLYYFKPRSSRLILWMWNSDTGTSTKVLEFISDKCEIWTFDESDARRNGWKLNTQFYFKPTEANKRPVGNRKAAFFVGADKNRYRILRQLKGMLEAHETEADFWMVGEAGKEYDPDDLEWIKDEEMPYEQVLEHIFSDDILIDIVKEGQVGFTVRILEALFYGRKVITNNKAVLESEFYDRDAFFVIGHDDWSALGDFLARGSENTFDDQSVGKYDFSEWLSRFF